MKFADKIVVVTGAGSGIGRATALAFAAAGARVAVCDVHAERIAAVGAELGPRALLAERVDVADRAQLAAFAAAVHARAPAADVIVNNAGVACGGSFVETSREDFDWVLDINLRAVVDGCRLFVPKMVERGAGGQVVNISSIFGIVAPPQLTAYVASKWAVLGFSQSLRVELAAHRIGVTAICPGLIATAILDDSRLAGAVGDRRAKLSRMFKKGLHPDEVARAIVDAVHSNPAVRTVGRDSWAMRALTRIAPSAVARFSGTISRRYAGGA